MDRPLLSREEGLDGDLEQSFKNIKQGLLRYQQISSRISKHTRAMKNTSSAAAAEKTWSQARELIDDGQAVAKRLAGQLKEFGKFANALTSGERKRRRIQHKKLDGDFQKQMGIFEKVVRQAFAERDATISEAGRRASSEDPWNSSGALGGTARGAKEDPQVSAQEFQQSQVIMVHNEELIQERQDAMLEVRRNVQTVNDIFKDLSTLVEDQGEQIVTVESEINDAADRTKAGVKELDKANEYSRSAKKKMTFCATVSFIALAVVIVYVVINQSGK
eukprot:g2466.t1